MTDSGDRLDRIEALVQANAEAIAAMREAQAQTRQDLRDSITDVVEMISDLGQRQAETDQRFNTLLAELRSDRQTNRTEHREFRAFMRETLTQLSQIWQRLVG